MTHPTNDILIDYLHGQLAPDEDAAIHAHLAGCLTCREQRDAELHLSEVLRAHARAQEREMPPHLPAKIRAAATQPRTAQGQLFSLVLRPVVAFPIAAAAALAIYFGFGTHGLHAPADGPATIDAAYYLEDHMSLANSAPFAEGAVMPAVVATEQTGDGQP
jgi:anti-sigma factor RsiW